MWCMSTKLREIEGIIQVSALPFPPLWAELITFVFQVPRKFLKLKFCFFCKEVKKDQTAKKQEPTPRC